MTWGGLTTERFEKKAQKQAFLNDFERPLLQYAFSQRKTPNEDGQGCSGLFYRQ